MKSINNRLRAVSKNLADWNLIWYLLFFVGFSLLVWGSIGFGLDVLLRGEYVSLIRFHSVVLMLIFLLSALLLGHFLFRISIHWQINFLTECYLGSQRKYPWQDSHHNYYPHPRASD